MFCLVLFALLAVGYSDEMTRVSIANARMSSTYTYGWYRRWEADRAYDGDAKTFAATEDEMAPWYSAELGVRFSAVKLTMVGYLEGDDVDSYTLYIDDNGVETECAAKDVSSQKDWSYFDWTVECAQAGTGFKLVARPNKQQDYPVRLGLAEVVVDAVVVSKEMSPVSIASTAMSSVYYWSKAKATDGNENTWALTDNEDAPWWSAELAERFESVRLTIKGYRYTDVPDTYTVYTVDSGVETLCGTRNLQADRQFKVFTMVMVCPNAGTGFKMYAAASKERQAKGIKPRMGVAEVTVEISQL